MINLFTRSDHLKKHMHSHVSESANGVTGAEIEIDPTQLLEVEQYGAVPQEEECLQSCEFADSHYCA